MLKFKKAKTFDQSSHKEVVVLHVSTPKSWRGGEQQLFYLMEELERQNVKQYLICNAHGELYLRAKSAGWNVYPCRKRSAIDLNFAHQIKHLCVSLGVNCIHTHDSQAHSLAVMSTAILKNKVPIVVSRRVDFPVSKSFFSSFKYNHPMVARILCVSDAIKKVMQPSIKKSKKLVTVHSGVNLERFEGIEKSSYLRDNYKVAQDELIIGNVSAIAPHKDYYSFVNAVALLKQSGLKAKYFVIGAGPEKVKIKQYVQAKSLQDDIYFTGFIEDILPVLKSLDIFLMTSKTEGLGTTILDAFGCGVPVVATGAGGIPELVQNEQTGLLAKIEDPEDIANKMIRMVSSPELQKKVVAGSQLLLQEFSRQKTAKQTLEIYQEVAGTA